MADIFISYARVNQPQVALLAQEITRAGYSVWWDAELPPHRSYGDVITEQIAAARAAIVVWSATAAASEWVRAEADLARQQKKLIQASLDDILPPMPFNQIQFAYIGDWNGEADHLGWRKIKASLAALCGEGNGAVATAAPLQPGQALSPAPALEPAASRGALLPALAGGAVVAAGAIGFIVWNGSGAEAPSLAVAGNMAAPASTLHADREKETPVRPLKANAASSGSFDLVAEIADPRPGPTNVRAGPSVNDPIVAAVNDDEHFATFRQRGAWWQVRTATGKTGWMSRRMIRIRADSAGTAGSKE